MFTLLLPHLQLSTTNNLALELDTGSAYSWSISMATPSDLKPSTGLNMLPVAASSPFPTSASSPFPTSGSDHSRVCEGSVSSEDGRGSSQSKGKDKKDLPVGAIQSNLKRVQFVSVYIQPF